jgi:crotonobetainyl-CoA:carnitine CoA-transferase CaiB-like acyl-CoA transferase
LTVLPCRDGFVSAGGVLALSGEGLLESSVTGQDVVARGNRGSGGAPHGVYPCRGDDQWVALTVAVDGERFDRASGRRTHRDDLDRLIGSATASADKVALAAALQAQGIEAFPAATAADLVVDPQLEHRGYFVEVPLRGETVRLPGTPYVSSPPITRTHHLGAPRVVRVLARGREPPRRRGGAVVVGQ